MTVRSTGCLPVRFEPVRRPLPLAPCPSPACPGPPRPALLDGLPCAPRAASPPPAVVLLPSPLSDWLAGWLSSCPADPAPCRLLPAAADAARAAAARRFSPFHLAPATVPSSTPPPPPPQPRPAPPIADFVDFDARGPSLLRQPAPARSRSRHCARASARRPTTPRPPIHPPIRPYSPAPDRPYAGR